MCLVGLRLPLPTNHLSIFICTLAKQLFSVLPDVRFRFHGRHEFPNIVTVLG